MDSTHQMSKFQAGRPENSLTSSDSNNAGPENFTSREDSTGIPISVAKSPLFRLPPEIRTAIYRLSLTKPEGISTTKISGIPEHSLLSTCKVIRSEASGIFYWENVVHIEITSWHPAACLLIVRKFGSLQPYLGHPPFWLFGYWTGTGMRNWLNFKWWLGLWRKKEVGRPPATYMNATETVLVDSMFALGECCGDVSDAKFDEMVDAMRPALIAIHPHWGQD